ncbi:MAG TPA: flavin reductase family protein [Candidatus Dormibacteraeota bacterium]|nr:flavin reductase family protein [Candidatus Dormibacteraeota bacterium]
MFRQAFRRHATTVAIITYLDGAGRPCGMTATSMCSLSASPPSLLASISRASRAHAALSARGRFGVNLLSIGQRSVALHCSVPGQDKRLRDEWLASDAPVDASPRLRGSLAHLECTVDRSFEVFSHSLFVGLINGAWLNPVEAPPLLYHGGVYSQLESAIERSERFHWELQE